MGINSKDITTNLANEPAYLKEINKSKKKISGRGKTITEYSICVTRYRKSLLILISYSNKLQSFCY